MDRDNRFYELHRENFHGNKEKSQGIKGSLPHFNHIPAPSAFNTELFPLNCGCSLCSLDGQKYSLIAVVHHLSRVSCELGDDKQRANILSMQDIYCWN